MLKAKNRLGDAEALMRRALKIFERYYGPNHPKVATSLNNLATVLQDMLKMAEAEPLLRRALDIDETSYGPDHSDVGRDLHNLALTLFLMTRIEEAEPLMRRALHIFVSSFGKGHPTSKSVERDYMSVLQLMGTPKGEFERRIQIAMRG